MRVVIALGHLAKPLVEVSNEVGRIRIRRLFSIDVTQAQFLNEPVLHDQIGTLDSARRLAAIRAERIDIEFV